MSQESSEKPVTSALMRQGFSLALEIARTSPLAFAVALFCSVLFAAGLVGSSWVLGRVVEGLVMPTFASGHLVVADLWLAIAALLAVTIMRSLVVVGRRYFAMITAEQAQIRYRKELIEQILHRRLSWFYNRPSGEFLAVCDTDVERSVELMHPLPFSVGAGCIALFSIIYLGTVDPLVMVVALVVFPVLIYLNNLFSHLVEGPAAFAQQAIAKVTTIGHESFAGALVVKTLGRAEAEGERFGAAVDELARHRTRIGYLRAIFEPSRDTLPVVAILIAVVISGYRVDAGHMGVGDMVAVVTIFSMLGFPIAVLGFFLESIPMSLVSKQRYDNLVNQPGRIATVSGYDGTGLGQGPLAVTVEGLEFSYPGVETGVETSVETKGILSGINFRIEPGQVVALVGSTGSGKSTLCLLLAGLLEPDAGRVLLAETPIEQLSEDERTAAVSIGFQEPFLFARSLLDNIDLHGRADEEELWRAVKVSRVEEFLDVLPDGLDTMLGERGVNLSGGQRQRVALARAVLTNPRFLILDDATSAIDPEIEQLILNALKTELGTTFIVAQRVATIMLADKVLYLQDGHIQAEGTHEELLANQGYNSLIRAYGMTA